MLCIIDNGRGAQELSSLIRMSHQIVSPKDISRIASAYILSDGDIKHQKENEKIIKSIDKPVLAVGIGCVFLGAAHGAKVKKVPKVERTERLTIKSPCPLTLDLKKMFTVVESYQHILDSVPEECNVLASSQKYDYEIISFADKPFFGVQFCPEKGGDGRMILANFERFVEMWEKYHKQA